MIERLSSISFDSNFGVMLTKAKIIAKINSILKKKIPGDLAEDVRLTNINGDTATVECKVQTNAFNVKMVQNNILNIINYSLKNAEVQKIKIIIN